MRDSRASTSPRRKPGTLFIHNRSVPGWRHGLVLTESYSISNTFNGHLMHEFLHNLLFFAQAAAEKEAAPKEAPQTPNLLLWIMPAFLILLLWQFMFNPRRRDEKKRAELVSSMKKNDRIVTIGGITGTVASVSEDQRYVTIKVEDNTRIKMLASSIQTVINDDSKNAASDTDKA